MSRTRLLGRARGALALSSLLFAAACTTTPSVTSAFAVGQEVSVEGSVLSVDTAPWTYDGNAVVTVATATSGAFKVQLPARWNLCKAQPHVGVRDLKPRDRVRAVGTMTGDNSLLICAQPQHMLRKLD